MRRLRLGLLALLALAVTAGPKRADGDGVSPDTFYVAASGRDSRVWGGHATYASVVATTIDSTTTASVIYGGRYIAGLYYIINGFFSINTSALPDNATVTSALLYIYVNGKNNADTRNFTGDWFAWYPNDLSDWSYTAQTSAFSTAISGLTTPGYNSISLSSSETNVSKTAYTELRVHVDGGVPTGANDVKLDLWDSGSNFPGLIVAWTTPSGPTSFTIGGIGKPAAINGIPWASIRARNGRP